MLRPLVRCESEADHTIVRIVFIVNQDFCYGFFRLLGPLQYAGVDMQGPFGIAKLVYADSLPVKGVLDSGRGLSCGWRR